MHELKVSVEGATLAASYSPAGSTALIALHSAGEGRRSDSRLYAHLHEVLPAVGVGVVTFDRRGEGESTGDASRGRFQLQAEDALAIAESIDADRTGLWGFSQGGWVAPLAAASSGRVSFLVLVASTGVTPLEQMTYATAAQLRLAGYGEDVVERGLGLRRRFEAWARGHGRDDAQRLRDDLLAGLDQPWFTLLFIPPGLPDEEGCRLWLEEMDFDPRAVFAQVRVPVLAFYGERDSWTPVAPSVDAWRLARGDGVDIVVVPEAEHDLTLPDESLAPEYERTLTAWLDASS